MRKYTQIKAGARMSPRDLKGLTYFALLPFVLLAALVRGVAALFMALWGLCRTPRQKLALVGGATALLLVAGLTGSGHPNAGRYGDARAAVERGRGGQLPATTAQAPVADADLGEFIGRVMSNRKLLGQGDPSGPKIYYNVDAPSGEDLNIGVMKTNRNAWVMTIGHGKIPFAPERFGSTRHTCSHPGAGGFRTSYHVITEGPLVGVLVEMNHAPSPDKESVVVMSRAYALTSPPTPRYRRCAEWTGPAPLVLP